MEFDCSMDFPFLIENSIDEDIAANNTPIDGDNIHLFALCSKFNVYMTQL